MTWKASSKRTRSISGCFSSESSPAAEIIADNADLLTEILLRLPAKSLLRFKCVSKHWLSLISASQFARLHSRRNPRPPISGLYCFRNRQLESISLNGGPTDLPSLSFLDGPGGGFRVRIIHSCNGLLLCKKFPTVGDGKKSQLIVCNPTTGKYVVIPEPGGDSYESGCLAFDPSKSRHYKLVLVNPPSSSSLEINIFSSGPASWRKIWHIDRGCGEGFLWNGAIHWLCDPNSFLRFDVETEEIIWIPFPSSPKIRSLDQIKYFGECGGCLILIHSHSPSAMGYRILEMDKDYRRWIVRCQVNLRPLISAFSEIITGKYHDYFSVLCVVEGEKENDFALVLAIPGKVISYQPKSKTWNVLRELAPGDVNYNDYVYPFVQSLAPVYAPMFF